MNCESEDLGGKPKTNSPTNSGILGDVGVPNSRKLQLGTDECLTLKGSTGVRPRLMLDEVYTRQSRSIRRRRRRHPAGKFLFNELGCSDCHHPGYDTNRQQPSGHAPKNLAIHGPLHDMGEALADNPPSYANGRETPSMGIGIDSRRQQTRQLSTMERRGLRETILWHGGEALQAQQGFKALPRGRPSSVLRVSLINQSSAMPPISPGLIL